jgi:signal transduction histidine kinase/DNA-binding response OmpR family regulator
VQTVSDSKRQQQAFRLAAFDGRDTPAAIRPVVWLLEDSPLQAEETRRALTGFEVLHFADGGPLLEALSHAEPDVLVLDWELPGVSGLDVLRYVRETRDELTLPVLVLTSDKQAMLDALAAGANDFVSKPCEPIALRARAQTLVRVHALHRRTRAAEQERTDALERVYEAETRMYVALEAAKIGTWELDPRTRAMQLDPGTQALMGLAANVAYTDLEKAIHPDDRARVTDALAAALDPSRRAAFAIEYRVSRDDGAERWNAVWAQCFFEEDLPVRLVGAMVDATDRKLASDAMARDAAFRERFIAILAHDLRTPLTALRLSAQMLARGKITLSNTMELGRRIEATTSRMDRMIADLLDFTRARQGGGMPVLLAESDFESICRSVVQELQVASPHRPIVLETSGDTRGRWDAGRLQQIVSNLVSNAIDYSPPATAVHVTLRAVEDRVVLDVQNLGDAIPEATLRSLFDPFRRGASESTSSKNSRGLGLGLYIVDQITSAHRGRITVRSDEQTGTTFSVSLPR